VRASQRETGGAVIERSGVPALVVWHVAHSSPQKAGPDVEWTGSSSVAISSNGIRIPALRRRNRQSVIVVDMARSAGHVGVPVGQQEARRAVIEDRRGPRKWGVMASRAVGHPESRARRGVHWISRLLPGRQVAARIPAVRRPIVKLL